MAEELKQVFDPRGGQWNNGRYVPSLVAAIGDIIERHMLDTGFLQIPEKISAKTEQKVEGALKTTAIGPLCPKCSQP